MAFGIGNHNRLHAEEVSEESRGGGNPARPLQIGQIIDRAELVVFQLGSCRCARRLHRGLLPSFRIFAGGDGHRPLGVARDERIEADDLLVQDKDGSSFWATLRAILIEPESPEEQAM
jgi:hypothetical protein